VSLLQGGAWDHGEIRERIGRVLAREEFRRGGHGLGEWLDEKLGKAARWLGDLLGIPEPAFAKQVLEVLLVLLGIALLAALVSLIRRKLRARGLADRAEAPSPVEEHRAAGVVALRREARAASQRGDHLAALRSYFRALVLGLSERGHLEYRDAWTNRELLERGAPRRELLPLLSPLVPRLDAQSFGREPTGPEDVARLADLCDRLLGGRIS
jgi:hypothetical protein